MVIWWLILMVLIYVCFVIFEFLRVRVWRCVMVSSKCKIFCVNVLSFLRAATILVSMFVDVCLEIVCLVMWVLEMKVCMIVSLFLVVLMIFGWCMCCKGMIMFVGMMFFVSDKMMSGTFTGIRIWWYWKLYLRFCNVDSDFSVLMFWMLILVKVLVFSLVLFNSKIVFAVSCNGLERRRLYT